MKYITVDVRMICSSGIGTVIQNILERVIPQCTECFFYLIGKTDDLKNFKFSYFPNVSCIMGQRFRPVLKILRVHDIV